MSPLNPMKSPALIHILASSVRVCSKYPGVRPGMTRSCSVSGLKAVMSPSP